MAIDGFALRAVDAVLHPVGVVGLALVLDGERDLPSRAFSVVGRSRILHALMLLEAMSALEKTAFEVHSGLAVLRFALALVTDGFARRADTGHGHRIELELTGGDDLFPA